MSIKLGYVSVLTFILSFCLVKSQASVPLQERILLQDGLIGMSLNDGKFWLEIPLKLLDKDLIITPTIISTSARTGKAVKEKYGYAGDRFPGSLIRFQKNGDHVVEIVLPPTKERLLINDIEAKKAWKYAYDIPILQQFQIINITDTSLTIDFSEFLNGKRSLFSLADFAIDLGIDKLEGSSVVGFYGTPKHSEIRLKQSYNISPYADKNNRGIRDFEIAFAISKLEDIPLESRTRVKDIGYFGLPFCKIDHVLKGSESCMIAQRWRLEPLDTISYKENILTEPIKPIIFYVDPNTPSFLKSYFKEAVEVWKPIFQSAGFKNAIIALSEQDTLVSLGDPNISFISYKPSGYRNAYGPRNLDPRSGEILSSSVGVFHDIISLVEEYYFTNCLMLDPRCSPQIMPDSLTGELMKLVVAHEIGHSLGLEHNFGGSATRTIENLKDRNYLGKHGISNSIMDYVRFNYVANPEDSIAPIDLIARIGSYDHLAISWGYRWINKFAKDHFVADLPSSYNTGENVMFIAEGAYQDSRAQANDLSNDPITASVYGMEKIQYAMSFTHQNHNSSLITRKRFNALFNWYQLFIGHVVKHIGSSGMVIDVNGNPKLQTINFQQQLAALDFLDTYLFQMPEWLVSSELTSLGILDADHKLTQLIEITLSDLLQRYSLVIDYEKSDLKKDYSALQLLQAINDCIFNDWRKGVVLSAGRRKLQMIHLNNMCNMIKNGYDKNIAQVVYLQTELERIQQLAQKMKRIANSKENTRFFTRVLDLIAK